MPVVDSITDYLHGFVRWVEEIFLPEVGVAFNELGYVLEASERRYKGMELPAGRKVEPVLLSEVEVADEDVRVLQGYLAMKARAREVIAKYLTLKK